MTTEANPQPLLGIAISQTRAIRDALCWGLGGQAIHPLGEASVVEWLNEQGLEDPRPDVIQPDSPVSIVLSAVNRYRHKVLQGHSMNIDVIGSSGQNPSAKEIGRERGGGGWNQGASFCISSAFVRLLGASEQFELDVLKALFHYRPHGSPLGPDREQEMCTVELDVVTEKPECKDNVEYYTKPALWTWIKRHAEGSDERRKIFKRVFGLDLRLGKTDSDKKNNNKARKEWYTKRNAIAHGRAGVTITLSEYLDAEALTTQFMLQLALLCRERQKLIV